MKKNNRESWFFELKKSLRSVQPPLWFFFVAIAIAAIGLILVGPSSISSRSSLKAIKVGEIAETDIYAGKDTIYIDKEATQRKIQAEERLVLAVLIIFDRDEGIAFG